MSIYDKNMKILEGKEGDFIPAINEESRRIVENSSGRKPLYVPPKPKKRPWDKDTIGEEDEEGN